MMKTKTMQKTSRDSPTIRLKYKAQGPKLSHFHTTDEFVTGLIGPLGSGKTFGAINKMLSRIHNAVPDRFNVRRSRWCVARNTFPDLNSATIPDFRSITDKLPFGTFSMGAPPSWKARYPRSDGTIVDTEVLFRSFDGLQDVKKARGMQLTGVWVDELGEFNKANFDMLIGRVKRYPPKVQVPKARFDVLFSSNAVARDHWLADLALQQTPEGWSIGIQAPGVIRVGNRWKENPDCENYKNLPIGYYSAQCGGKKDSWIRQNLANEFVYHSDGRAIHPDFNEQLHVDDILPTHGIQIWLGMDWGRTPAAVIMQQQPNGQWFVLEEVVLKNAGADKLGTTVKRVLNARYSGFTIAEATGDPAGTAMTQARDETPFDLFNLRSSLNATPAHTNDPEVRFATLDNLLTTLIEGHPAIMVDRSCQTLIGGLSGEYQFKRIQVSGEEKFHDQPDKGPSSHVCEALHYGLMGAGESDVLFDSAYEDIMQQMNEGETNDAVFE
jgi:hypothetical protein